MSEAGGNRNILLVKIGGSSITEKAKLETLNVEALEWFSKTIRSAVNDAFLSAGDESTGDETDGNNDDNDDDNDNNNNNNNNKPAIIIVHGAGSFGHHTAKQHGLRGTTSPPPDGMRLTRDLVTGRNDYFVKKLNGAVVSDLIENGINAVGISPCLNVPGLMTHGGNENNGATLLVRSLLDALSAGLVPVVHGDAGLYGICNNNDDDGNGNGDYDGEASAASGDRFRSVSAGILGGDTLVEIIATHPLVRGSLTKTVFLTDVDGVFTKDPKACSDAALVKNISVDPESGEVMNELSASGSSHEHDVTGGLEAKLGAAATVAKTGIDVIVARCGSVGAVIAMSETDSNSSAPNTGNYTVIRKHQP
eukprot:jgi/Psemu1/202657/e_gw1.305.29.1